MLNNLNIIFYELYFNVNVKIVTEVDNRSPEGFPSDGKRI